MRFRFCSITSLFEVFSLILTTSLYSFPSLFLIYIRESTGEDKEKEMMSLTRLPNVQTVSVDMCEHGLRVRLRDGSQSGLVRPASTIVTNVPEIAEAIQRRCSGLHKHHVLEGSFQTQQAAKYTNGFVDAAARCC